MFYADLYKINLTCSKIFYILSGTLSCAAQQLNHMCIIFSCLLRRFVVFTQLPSLCLWCWCWSVPWQPFGSCAVSVPHSVTSYTQMWKCPPHFYDARTLSPHRNQTEDGQPEPVRVWFKCLYGELQCGFTLTCLPLVCRWLTNGAIRYRHAEPLQELWNSRFFRLTDQWKIGKTFKMH